MSTNQTITAQKATDDAITGELVIYFVEDGPWPEGINVASKQLQDRILDVIDASIDGGVAMVYPDSVGRPIRIQIDSPSGVPNWLNDLVEALNSFLSNSQEYSDAIKSSRYLSALRVVTGHSMGRFGNKR